MSSLLLPLAWLYGAIVSIRNVLFDWRWFAATKTPAFVVSVGNITAGGTGKTPITAYLCKELENRGHRVAIVSRGYGGSYNESAVKVDADVPRAAMRFGDEPVMLAKQLGIPVFVGRSRVDAADLALREYRADTLVADDGFQHRWLHRDVNCVVFDATETRLQMLPAGRLREPLCGLRRADVVFVTRAGSVGLAERDDKISLLNRYGFSEEKGNLFFVDFRIANIVHVHTHARMTGNHCFLVSAIGKPENFEMEMKLKYQVLGHFRFRDHHVWSQAEWDGLLESCRAQGGAPLVMTEKDAVKVRALKSDDYPVYFTQSELIMDERFKIETLLKTKGSLA